MPELSVFSLVGGTALSLMYGHRKSEDLDLFSEKPFENKKINTALKKKFKDKFVVEDKPPRFGIFCFIDQVKVDIIRHPHPVIRPPLEIEDIRMYSVEDIIAMKVQAVLGRGKKKDFWDITELLKHYTVEDFVQFHSKHPTKHILSARRSGLRFAKKANE